VGGLTHTVDSLLITHNKRSVCASITLFLYDCTASVCNPQVSIGRMYLCTKSELCICSEAIDRY